MTNAQHTPGPWYVQESDHPNTGLLIKPIPGQVVAECDPVPEMQANARLIAAAPELLEALKEAKYLIDQHYDPASDRVKLINAAIAKAEGGAA